MTPRTQAALEDAYAAIDALARVAAAEGDRVPDLAAIAMTALVLAVREERAPEGELLRITMAAAGW